MFEIHLHIFRLLAAQILVISGSLFISITPLNAQINFTPKKEIPKDSTEIAPQDTIKRFPLKSHGRLMHSQSNHQSLNKYDIQFNNYVSINNIIEENLDVFPLDLGGYGQNNSFSMNGGYPSSIEYSFNSRPVFDPLFGQYSSEQYPTEFFENIEIFTGSDAVIFSDNSSGTLINFQEAIYNTKKPFTRMFYVQGPYDYIQADGIFSKNITSELNFGFGFRTQNSKGRYENSNLESWNLRTFLRWNPSDYSSISLTDIFSNHKIGLFGGVNPNYDNDIDGDGQTSIYDEIEAGTRLPSFRERNYRHDITLKYTTVDLDSNHVLTSSLFFSNSEMIWDNYSAVISDTILYKDVENTSNYYGINGQYEFHNFIDWIVGGKFYYINLDPTRFSYGFKGWNYSAYSRVSGEISNLIRFSGGVKYGTKYDKDLFSVGGSIVSYLTDSTKFKFDISQSNRVPNPSENLMLDSEIHRLILAEFEHRNGFSLYRTNAFIRNIDKPIFPKNIDDTFNGFSFSNGSTMNIVGLNMRLKNKIAGNVFKENDFIELNCLLQGNYNIDNPDKLFYPLVYANLSIIYQLNINRSILRIGVRAKGSSEYNGFYYTPLTRSYMYDESNSSNIFNGIDAFLQARLGTAHIRAEIQNLISYQYYYIPYYPMNEMNFKLIISWSFLE